MIRNGLKKYEDYAQVVLEQKNLEENSISLADIAKALSDSFERTYHAVALDIDGTIKKSNEKSISEDILKSIARVIKSGAYVLFVTGSGETTVTQTLNQVKSALPRSKNVYLKVRAIDGNGCRLFFISQSGAIKNVPIVEPIKEKIKNDDYIYLLKDIQSNLGKYLEIHEKKCGIRLVSIDNKREDFKKIVRSWYEREESKYRRLGIRLVSGKWGNKETFDISITDKDYALAWFYTEFDFIDVPILRIGDQGKEDRNDYTFLDSPYGFSVGSLSSKPTKCFPIYDRENNEVCKGIEGTRYLLDTLKWSPRLTIPSSLVPEFSNEYNRICDMLRTKAENNNSKMLNLWSKQAKFFFSTGIIRTCKETEFSNLFDHRSGAVRLTDMEWNSLEKEMLPSEIIPLTKFFLERDPNLTNPEKYPGLIRSLYTDSGIILRGPRYYTGLSENPSIDQVKNVIEEHCKILNIILGSDSIFIIKNYSNSACKFTSWKLCLGMLDNFRNSSLLLYNMLFQAASLNTGSRPYWKRLLKRFEPYIATCIDIYYSMLLVDVDRYMDAISKLRGSIVVLYDLKYNIKLLYDFLESNGIESDKIIRKWREVDHPGQILSAINSINKEVSKLLANNSNLCALGLMYGGIELPFAFRSYYGKEFSENIKVAEVMGISFYGQERSSAIMKQYSRDVLESAIPSVERLEEVIAPGDTAIIFDDNIMTGRSIELARDRLLTYGIEVPFAVCIRFPRENRIYQMKMRRHGGIDPCALGNDIKGLIAQSPYSRIFTSTSGYKDVTGVFDLSRQRIIKYLKKNGLTVQEDL